MRPHPKPRRASRIAAPHKVVEEIEANPAGLTSVNAALTTHQYIMAMWDRREFAIEVPMEQLRAAHRTTLLGNVWHLGNPLLFVGVYYLIFGVIFQVNRGVDHFLLWLTIGVFAFQLTSKTVLGGANAITANSGLIRAIKFPRALLPISVVINQLLSFGIEIGVLATLALLSGVGISQRWLLLPFVVIVHTALNLGLAFIAARLNDTFKDVQQIIPFIFRILQYFSGVMFPLALMLDRLQGKGWIGTLAGFNPLARIIDLYRWLFLGTELAGDHLVMAVAIPFVILWFGFRYFKAAELRYGRA